MSRMSQAEAETMIDVVLLAYHGVDLDKVGGVEHFDKVAATYADVIEGEPVDDQMWDMAALIAVLFWRAARAEAAVRELRDRPVAVGGGGGGLSASSTAHTTGGRGGGGASTQ